MSADGEQREPSRVRVTSAGMVFRSAPPGGFGREGPKMIKGSKPVDILDRKPGQCAAVVKSEGLIHHCCGRKLGRLADTGYDYCDDHDPFCPELTGSTRELIRGLRKYTEK